MSKYVVADIHGCFNTLQELLYKIGLNKSDQIYFLGDYINRGQKSREVIDYLIKLEQDGYNLTTLKGNHEEMVFDSLHLEYWPAGSEETLTSFGISELKLLKSNYIKWLENLKPYIEVDNFILVHAGLDFKFDNPFDDSTNLYWIKDWYKSIDFGWLKKRSIIHGHVPIEINQIKSMINEIKVNQVLNLDNGCFMKGETGFGSLCCMNLTNMELSFQSNIDQII